MPGFSNNTGVTYAVNSPDQNINGVAGGSRWSQNLITFNFPDSIGAYPAGYGAELGFANLAQLTANQIAATTTIIQTQFAAVIPNTFQLVGNTAIADISSARVDLLNQDNTPLMTGWAYFPGTASSSGDVWYRNTDGAVTTATLGNYSWMTILHELGHTMGLKHGHEAEAGVPMTADRNSMEFSVMTYAGYIGAPTGAGYVNETFGYAQSLMMYDIAALQFAYGANFTTRSDASVYKFEPNTGEMSVNGVGQGAPGANRVFLTIWDGGGVDTYDLSLYTTNLSIDLTPGGWSKLSDVQLADLGDGNMARANVFNALQYQGDLRSLIENAIGGWGNDSIKGNAADNVLTGGAGNDTLDGGAGTDTANYADRALAVAINPFLNLAVVGGGEFDTILNFENFTGGGGNDTLQGTLGANVIAGGAGNDLIYGFDGADLVDGGAGNDVIAGGIGDDTITGGDGGDWLYGEDGNDNLSGTAKSGGAFDVMVGGLGDDTMEGSAGGFDYFYGGTGAAGADGHDITIVRANSGIKVMNDFEAGGANDAVRLLGTGLASFAQAQAAMSFSGVINGTVLVVDDATQIWFLNGTQPANLTAADFLFA
jgi:serralysin